MGTIRKGSPRPNRRATKIYGIGTFDYNGLYTDDEIKVCNHVWRDMLKRTTAKYQETHVGYKGTTVCNEWLSFNNFKAWFDKNYIKGNYLDKDVLSQGEKVYSPDTCCFLPKEINCSLISRKKPNSTLPRGVQKKPNGRYCVYVCNYSKIRNIGTYNTPQEAYMAYKKHKENYIHELAEKFYKQGFLKDYAYKALKKWELND